MDGKTFENEYSELGGLVHQLKYGNPDGEAFERLVDEILHIALPTLDSLGFLKVPRLAVVPMPSTADREFDLVARLARRIAARFDLPYRDDILIKNSGVHAKHLELGSEFADGDFESIPFSTHSSHRQPRPDSSADHRRRLRRRTIAARMSARPIARGHDGRIYFLSMVYTRDPSIGEAAMGGGGMTMETKRQADSHGRAVHVSRGLARRRVHRQAPAKRPRSRGHHRPPRHARRHRRREQHRPAPCRCSCANSAVKM